MNYEELAYVNQQLAGMLRSGLPLEGALRQLSADMKGGALREELRQLEADLAKGTPLRDALAARRLPEFYVRMLQLGTQSNDLPGVLTLLADHYQRAGLIWTRLKGLMVYPVIVLVAGLGVSALIAFFLHAVFAAGTPAVQGLFDDFGRAAPWTPAQVLAITTVPSLVLVILLAAALIAVGVPAARRRLRWTLPAFKEGSLANLGSTLSLVLAKGGTLGDALELAGRLEQGTPAEAELGVWKDRLADGRARFADLAAGSRAFPPLFVWLVAQGGEDLATGLRRAAEVYFARAMYRTELLLYLALPVSVLTLGLMIVFQFVPILRAVILAIDMLGGSGG